MALSSFLGSLGSGASNVLQALAPREQLQGYQPVAVEEVQVSMPQVQQQSQAPARPRRSMLQTIGQISDVLASVGGANPLYQAGIDAQKARELEGVELADQRFGAAMQGAQALLQSGANEQQLMTALPQLMRQAGVADERAAEIISQVQQNPQLIRGLMGASGVETPDPKYGGTVQYARMADGTVKAYTLNNGQRTWLDLEGGSPFLPVQVVNAGDRTALVDRFTPQEIEHGTRPDTAANNAARFDIARLNNASRERMQTERLENATYLKTLKDSGAGEADVAKAATALNMLDEMKGIYTSLNERNETVSTNANMAQNLWNAMWSSGAGQTAGRALGSERQADIDRIEGIRPGLLMMISQANGVKATQMNSNVELENYKKILGNPASSYEANMRAIAGVEQLIRQGKTDISPSAAAPAPAPRPNNRPARARPSNRPTNVLPNGQARTTSNW